MKALILVGGYGTRLRPLTLSVPKPLISFCNRSIVEHQIEALVQAGVKEIILAVAYRPNEMLEALNHIQEELGVTITCSREETPLGTAGPIRMAEALLMTPDDKSASGGDDVLDESFFVCNSDVICEFPLQEMKDFHQSHGGEGTVLVSEVEDPSKYGVVVCDNTTGQIHQFVEKPNHFVGNRINAGIYLLQKRAIQRIPQSIPVSIEKETFPAMAADGALYCLPLRGYWADIGQPADYLHGVKLHLQSLRERATSGPIIHTTPSGSCAPKPNSLESSNQWRNVDPSNHAAIGPTANGADRPSSTLNPTWVQGTASRLTAGRNICGNVLIHPTTVVGEDSAIGPNVTIGRNCVIGKGVRLKDCAVMDCVTIKDFAWLNRSIIGWRSTVGKWARIEGITVVGEDVHIADECLVHGAFILPHKSITINITEPGAIIM